MFHIIKEKHILILSVLTNAKDLTFTLKLLKENFSNTSGDNKKNFQRKVYSNTGYWPR